MPPARLRARCGLGRRLVGVVAALGAVGALLTVAPAPARAAFQAAAGLPGLGSGRVWTLAVDPGDPKTILAATDQGVYRSGDSGASWRPSSLKGVRAWTVAWDPRPPNVAYVGLAGKGIQRSTDEGSTWTDSSNGLGNSDVRSLAVGLEGMAAGTRDGVDVSPDGLHWRTAGLDGYSVASVVVAANQPQLTLVAGVDSSPPNAQGGGFLFRNKGGGLQWESLQQGLPTSTVVSSVTAGPLPTTGQPRPLLVTTTKGVYHSGDTGTTWTPSTGVPDQTTLTVSGFSPLDPNLVYAGADAGGSSGGILMRSTDAGASFTAVADALPDGHRNVDAVVVAGSTPPNVVVAVNPPSGSATIYHGPDAAAPAPGGTGQDSAGAALSSAVPTPKPTAHPKTTPHATPAPVESTGVRHIAEVAVRFPFPLVLEVLAILLVVYLVLRWRQRYLDVEGPP
jgi:hypothetical protein